LVVLAAVFAQAVVATAWRDGGGVDGSAFDAAGHAFQTASAGGAGFVVVEVVAVGDEVLGFVATVTASGQRVFGAVIDIVGTLATRSALVWVTGESAHFVGVGASIGVVVDSGAGVLIFLLGSSGADYRVGQRVADERAVVMGGVVAWRWMTTVG
jgi:hypothetical protein